MMSREIFRRCLLVGKGQVECDDRSMFIDEDNFRNMLTIN